MNAWVPSSQGLKGKVIGASVTNEPITTNFRLTTGGATDSLVIKITAASVTAGAGITAKLQSAIDNTFVDAKTVSVTGNGDFYIKLNNAVSADQAFLPLLSVGRVVVTTGAGSALTITDVQVVMEQ